MIKKLSYCLLIVVISIFINGCSAKNYLKIAESTYRVGEYSKALEYYRKAYNKSKDYNIKTELSIKLALGYQRIGQYDHALVWCRNAFRRDGKNPVVILLYAQVLQSCGKYDDAIPLYESYLKNSPGNRVAQNGLTGCRNARIWTEKQTRYEVSAVHELNSRWSDFSPTFSGKREDEVLFASSRLPKKKKRVNRITGEGYSDIYYSIFDTQKQKWGNPKPVDTQQLINTTEDEGAPSLGSQGDVLYFTRCPYIRNKNNGAMIFRSICSGGQWSEAEKVGLGGDSLISAHPSISADGKTLYFVSDRPGGLGGLDIWKIEKKGKDWSAPINMGPQINTPGNEAFPYIRENGDLYFSSDYHPGMGGYDLFKAHRLENGTWKIENLKAPVNSAGDDFGISFIGKEEKGMFSSNRTGSRSDDIYSFYLPPREFKLYGEVLNKETEQRERNSSVRIIGTDGTMMKINSVDGKFQLKLKPETEYVCAAFKDGYLNAKEKFSTKGLDDSKTFPVRLVLTPTDMPIKVNNVTYEFGKWEVPQGATASLDSLVGVMNENANIVIELMSHTDSRGDAHFNQELSQKRAQAAVEYLVSKGIVRERMVAKGYGKTWPKTVTKKIAKQYDFLNKGDELNEAFIAKLKTDQQKEICNMLNRRTEFRVVSTNYHEPAASEPGK